MLLRLIVFVLTAALGSSAFAWTPDQALRIARGESDAPIAAPNEVVLAADPALAAHVQAVLADKVKLAGGKA